MLKVRMITTGEVKEVEQNDAHALIESHQAELVTGETTGYAHRQFRPGSAKKYKTK